MRSPGGMILTQGHRGTRGKPCPTAILSTVYFARTGLRLKPGHRNDWLATRWLNSGLPSVNPLQNGLTLNTKPQIVFSTLHGRLSRVRVKAVPLQAWSGPEGSRKLRFPDFMTTAQDGGKVVSLTHRPPLPPRKYTLYSFLLGAESTPGP